MEELTTNTVSALVIAYDVIDMTHLRYFIPLAKRIEQIVPGKYKHIFLYTRRNKKYNGMASQINWDRYCTIISEFEFIDNIDRTNLSNCDILFTVESTDLKINHKRHISISHGLDLVTHAKMLNNCDAYVCSTIVSNLKQLKNINVVNSPFPFSLLDFEELRIWAKNNYDIDERKIATIFYPDHNHVEIANKVIQYLIDNEFNVFVKQRRKWQNITSNLGTHVYDVSWFPSEAIALPLISDVTIGFSSTAYIDLVQSEIKYIDCDVYNINNIDMSKWNNFVKVNNDYQAIINAIDNRSKQKSNKFCISENIDKFLMDLIS